MKRMLAGAAMLGAVAPLWAQNVTLFGVADLWVGTVRNVIAAPATASNIFGAQLEPARTKQLGPNGINAARIGFRGTEDLGDGMSASFMLENQIAMDTGTTPARFFHRQSWVSLQGKFGRVALGRQYTPWNDVASNAAVGFGDNFDPYVRVWRIGGPSPLGSPAAGTGLARAIGANNDVGDPSVWNHVRMDKSIRYDTPKIGNFSAALQVGLLDATKTPSAKSASVLYDDGKWRVGLGYHGQTTGVTAGALRFDGNNGSTVLAVNYDFGPAKAWTMYNVSHYDVFTLGRRLKSNEWSVGLTVPYDLFLFKASAAATDSRDVAGRDIGYCFELHYNLSKRTALYGAYTANKWGELLNGQANQKGGIAAVGLRHFF